MDLPRETKLQQQFNVFVSLCSCLLSAVFLSHDVMLFHISVVLCLSLVLMVFCVCVVVLSHPIKEFVFLT